MGLALGIIGAVGAIAGAVPAGMQAADRISGHDDPYNQSYEQNTKMIKKSAEKDWTICTKCACFFNKKTKGMCSFSGEHTGNGKSYFIPIGYDSPMMRCDLFCAMRHCKRCACLLVAKTNSLCYDGEKHDFTGSKQYCINTGLPFPGCREEDYWGSLGICLDCYCFYDKNTSKQYCNGNITTFALSNIPSGRLCTDPEGDRTNGLIVKSFEYYMWLTSGADPTQPYDESRPHWVTTDSDVDVEVARFGIDLARFSSQPIRLHRPVEGGGRTEISINLLHEKDSVENGINVDDVDWRS